MQNVHQQMQQLRTTVKSLNAMMARNDMLAARNPEFARKIADTRSANAHLYRDAAQKVQQANKDYALATSGMGNILAISLVGSVVGVAAVAAAALLFYMERARHEEFVAENPVAASVESATTAVWAILGLGVIALGGLVYWDYRQGREALPARSGGRRPFDRGLQGDWDAMVRAARGKPKRQSTRDEVERFRREKAEEDRKFEEDATLEKMTTNVEDWMIEDERALRRR